MICICKAMYLYQISVKNIPQSCILTHKRCISTTYLHINIYIHIWLNMYMLHVTHIYLHTHLQFMIFESPSQQQIFPGLPAGESVVTFGARAT